LDNCFVKASEICVRKEFPSRTLMLDEAGLLNLDFYNYGLVVIAKWRDFGSSLKFLISIFAQSIG